MLQNGTQITELERRGRENERCVTAAAGLRVARSKNKVISNFLLRQRRSAGVHLTPERKCEAGPKVKQEIEWGVGKPRRDTTAEICSFGRRIHLRTKGSGMGYKEQIACRSLARSAFLTLLGISYVLQRPLPLPLPPTLKNSQKEKEGSGGRGREGGREGEA